MDYLIAAANRFLAKPVQTPQTSSGATRAFARSTTTGRRIRRRSPAITCRSWTSSDGRAPLLTLFGGKITTYRRLAEEACDSSRPFFPRHARRIGRRREELPGGDVGHFNAFRDAMHARYPRLGRDLVEASCAATARARRRSWAMRGTPKVSGAISARGLTEHELEYLVAEEWAQTAEDVLWRRTKCGLHMTAQQREAVAEFIRRGT